GWQQVNANRPLSAFNVPVTIVDPGPDGVYGNSDDASMPALNLDNTSLPSNNVTQNIDGYEGTFKTLEFSANKRFSRRWSMNSPFSYTWTTQFGNNFYNNRFGTAIANFSLFGSYPSTPNEKTGNDYTDWNAKFSGTVDAGWGLRVTPVLQIQAGAPYGRFFSTRANELNYGTQLILVEPIGTRRQDTGSVLTFRVEKERRFAQRAKLGLFFDMFIALNSNTAVNINWRSGAWFEKATTCLAPRFPKLCCKFDW